MDGEYTMSTASSGHLSPGKSVGRKLQAARNQLEASEDFVAAALGLSVEAYRCVEAGTAQLSPGHVIQAAQLFGLQPSSLCIELDERARADKADNHQAVVIDLAAVRLRRQS